MRRQSTGGRSQRGSPSGLGAVTSQDRFHDVGHEDMRPVFHVEKSWNDVLNRIEVALKIPII